MDFFEVIQQRRSVRKFKPTVVPDQVIEKAIDAAFLAPNSSNMQPWEFYWVRSPEKKSKLVEACFGQGAASTASDLVVAVSRVDTWRRNRDLLLVELKKINSPQAVLDYYHKIVPLSYAQGPLGILGFIKRPLFALLGFFRPMPRNPAFRSDLFEVVSKTTALACENFMLAIKAQGYDSCPMEGFDEIRVKKILGLGRKAHVVMVVGVGLGESAGIYGERIRLDPSLFFHKL